MKRKNSAENNLPLGSLHNTFLRSVDQTVEKDTISVGDEFMSEGGKFKPVLNNANNEDFKVRKFESAARLRLGRAGSQ